MLALSEELSPGTTGQWNSLTGFDLLTQSTQVLHTQNTFHFAVTRVKGANYSLAIQRDFGYSHVFVFSAELNRRLLRIRPTDGAFNETIYPAFGPFSIWINTSGYDVLHLFKSDFSIAYWTDGQPFHIAPGVAFFLS